MSEGSSIQELTSRIRIETPKVEISQEIRKQKLLEYLNTETLDMAVGFLMPGDSQNRFPKAMALLSKNKGLLTELAEKSIDFENFATVIGIASNFSRFYNEQNQKTKGFFQAFNRYEIKKFADFSASLLNNNMERMEEGIKNDRLEWNLKSKLVSAIVNLAKSGEREVKEKAVRCLIGSLDIVLESDSSGKGGLNAISLATVLNTALKRGNPAQVESVKQWIIKNIREEDDSVRKVVAREIELIKFWEISSQTAKSDVVEKIVSAFGINGEQAVKAWMQSEIPVAIRLFYPSSTSTFYENLYTLLEIESQRSGIGKVLQQEFGISDFARYPKDLLIAQYDQRDTKDNFPHGVIIYPRDDHNGASYVNEPQLESLFSQLQGKCRIRVWEAKNLPEIVAIFNKSRHKYGQISFAIITGHGTPENISFDKEGIQRSKLEKADLKRTGIDSLKLAFVDNPTIILNSCSTGQLGGIGQEISKIGANVIAPIAPTNLDSISASILDDGRINFNVKYRKNISANTYSLGKQVEK